jgi:hypothetical protein
MVQGSGFRVQGSGFMIQGSGFRIQSSEFRVQGSGFQAPGSGFRLRARVSGFRVRACKGVGVRTGHVPRDHAIYSGNASLSAGPTVPCAKGLEFRV